MTEPLDHELVVRIYGHPAPKGSLKCVGGRGRHQLVEDSERTGPWLERLTRGVRRLNVSGLPGPLGVELTATIERPASHYGRGRNAGRVLPSAPTTPSRRATGGRGGDVDKLARVVLDALEAGGVIVDDAAVVELVARKSYPDGPIVLPDALDRPGVSVRLYPIN